MAYGKPKTPIMTVRRLILDGIRDKLDQHPAFQNDSLSVYDFACTFDITLSMKARAEDKAHIVHAIGGGEPPQEEKHGEVLNRPEVVSMKAQGEVKS